MNSFEVIHSFLEKVFDGRKKHLGKFYGFLSTICAFLNPAVIKFSQEKNTHRIICFRGVIIILISYFGLRARKAKANVHKNVVYKLLSRGFLGTIMFYIFYWSLNILSLQIAITLFQTSPISTYILGIIFTGEELTIKRSMCLFFCMIGFMLIVNPNLLYLNFEQDPKTDNFKYLSAAFMVMFAGFLKSIHTILSKTLKENDPFVNNYYSSFVAILLGGFGLIFTGTDLGTNLKMLCIFALSGIITFGMMSFQLLALKYEDASIIQIISSLTILYSFLVDVFIFEINPETGAVVGSVLIGVFMTVLIYESKS